MHLKRAYLAGEHDGEPLVHLIKPGEMVKTSGLAPAAEKFISCLRPDPRYTYVLCNAMGYSEFFGANSNKDWYGYNPHLDFNGLLHAWPDIGQNVEADRMKGKGWPYGYPCYYGATVYAHHKNTDPQQLGFGDVIFATLNPEMKRIELVKRVFNDEAAKKGHTSILDRVRAGERVDVSMGCFKAGAMVTMADGTRKPIEQIAVGDSVRTHTGGTGRVTELHRRRYKGEFFEIKPANEDPFVATVEHPFWAAFGAKDSHRVWKQEKPHFDWVYAKDLDGAVLSRPKITRTTAAGITPPMARILGYYLAEGHIVLNKKGEYAGIELTVNKADAVNEEIADLCAAVGTQNAPVWRQRENSEESFAIGIYDPEVAEACARLCGRYSKTKKLAEEVLYWEESLQYQLLGAYFDGDGFTADGDLLCSTASEDLAHQVREILFRLGIPTSYQELRHRAGSGKSTNDTFEWVISIGKQWAGQFAPHCSRARVAEVRKTKNIFKDYGDLWAVPIREYSSFYDEDDVYNFEVEGDNSYIVNGVAAHNCKVPFDFCSICTDWGRVKEAWRTYDESRHRHPGIAILEYHRKVRPIRGLAVTKVDYCQHMISEGGKVYPDGRKVFVYNDFPRFFDISFVWIGADRTARVMWHLSDPNAPKSVPRPGSPPPGTLERLLALIGSKLSMMEKDIPGGLAEAAFKDADTAPEVLDVRVVMRGSPTTDGVRRTLSTLAGLGIIPTPGEFQSMVLPTMPGGALVQKILDAKHAMFDTRGGGVDSTFAVDPALFDTKLADAYAPLMSERSSFAPFLHARLGEPGEKTASAKRAAYRGSDEVGQLAAKLASMYNGYRLSVLESAPELFPKVASHLDTDTLLDAQDSVRGKDLSSLLLGPAPMIQLISSHLRRNEDEGRQISTMSRMIANNPNFYAMSTIGAALRQVMGLDKSKGLAQAASSLVQEAGKGT
jgi:hypothetical protein